MWTLSTGGMTSAVFKNNQFMVRARDKESLEQYFHTDRIITNKGTDYPFRVYCSQREYADAIWDEIMDIDYGNFKSAAGKRRPGVYSSILHSVWSTLLRLEPHDAAKFIDRSWPVYSGYTSSYKSRSEKKDKNKLNDDVWNDDGTLNLNNGYSVVGDLIDTGDSEFEKELSIHDMTEEQILAYGKSEGWDM